MSQYHHPTEATTTRCRFLLPMMVVVMSALLISLGPATATFVTTTTARSLTAKKSKTPTQLVVFGNKKKRDEDNDLSFIETRDMTRDEMKRLNARNEEIMNAELVGMTAFSLIISIPMLYLVWVGFFSETAQLAGDF
jgi:hypothetical protein